MCRPFQLPASSFALPAPDRAPRITRSALRIAHRAPRQRSPLLDLFNPALHVEVALGHVVVLAVEDFLEAANGVGDIDLPALAAGEDLRRAERLAEEALDL